MKIVSTTEPASKIVADAIIAGVYSDQKLSASVIELDRATKGLVNRLLETREFTGEICQVMTLHQAEGVTAPIVQLVGLGPAQRFDQGAAFRAYGAAAKALSAKSRSHVAAYLSPDLPARLAEGAVAGILVGCQGQDLYRAEKKSFPFEKLSCGFLDNPALKTGQIIGDSVNLCRHWVNEPPEILYPFSFAERARVVASEVGIDFELWDEGRLQTERCQSLLSVARGSDRPPCLVIMRYQGSASADGTWLALVGKGVTFDSGGLSLKPTDNMKTMKCDMAGAATVVAAMQAIAQLQLPINIIGLMGLVENMPGPKAVKLGDVIRARNSKTIEVLNTDAEGRLVLADVLSVAIDQGADRIIDLATLTGSCVVALGNDVAGIMSNDADWGRMIMSAADSCGERVWELPMFEEYGEQIKSEIADIKNVSEGRAAGAIAGAKFLEHFVAGVPWVHIDIAGPAFGEKAKAWIDAGGTGSLVRTLIELARTWETHFV
jgi:leucyl aminopeptidase